MSKIVTNPTVKLSVILFNRKMNILRKLDFYGNTHLFKLPFQGDYNHVHSNLRILRIFHDSANFSFTSSETMRDYY